MHIAWTIWWAPVHDANKSAEDEESWMVVKMVSGMDNSENSEKEGEYLQEQAEGGTDEMYVRHAHAVSNLYFIEKDYKSLCMHW